VSGARFARAFRARFSDDVKIIIGIKRDWFGAPCSAYFINKRRHSISHLPSDDRGASAPRRGRRGYFSF
jgi:hypothetical protein